ncbi:MAG: glycoside hydrolase family 26 protein [Candidatus Pristimantibacillus sp.]
MKVASSLYTRWLTYYPNRLLLHRYLGLIAVLGFLLILQETHSTTGSPAMAQAEREWTIHVTSSDYSLSKAEPVSGIYLGAYVLQDSKIGYSMAEFNRLTGRKHASFFKYVGYGEPFPSEWVKEVKAEDAFPHIAWEPNNGLSEVKDDTYLREFAAAAGEADVPIFLRFASEMNGTWTKYSGDPEQYIQTWRMVHQVFEEEAPKTAMVWTVLNVPEQPIQSYYPGDEYVDWVGINIYNVKYHNGNLVQKAEFEDPLHLINYVYNLYSRTKPIQLSEYGATHFTTTDGMKDNTFAAEKIDRLYKSLPKLYPRIKAVYYFDVNNLTEYNELRRINDYSITEEQQLLDVYKKAVSGAYYLSEVPAHLQASSTDKPKGKQRFSYRGHVFDKGGKLYADQSFFTDVLKIDVMQLADGKINLRRQLGDSGMFKETQVEPIGHKIWSGYKLNGAVPILRNLNALPLVHIVRQLGYKVKLNGTSIYIQE